MRVVYEYLGLDQPHDFMGFWKIVEKATKKRVPLRPPMDGLNKQRVEFKHGGRLPNPKTVAALLPNVEAFCEEISQLYLGLDFYNASLSALIQNAEAKKRVTAADLAQRENDTTNALIELRFAFDALYQGARRKHGADLSKRTAWQEPHIRTGYSKADQQVQALIRSLHLPSIISQLNELTETVEILSLGGNSTSFWRFVRLTPHLIWTAAEGPPLPAWRDEKPRTQEDYEFCRSFVIDFALKVGL